MGEEIRSSTQIISGLIETRVLPHAFDGISQMCHTITYSASRTSWKLLPAAVATLTLGWLSNLPAPSVTTPVPEQGQDRGKWHLPSGSHHSLSATLSCSVLNISWVQLHHTAKEGALQILFLHPFQWTTPLPEQEKTVVLVQERKEGIAYHKPHDARVCLVMLIK